MPTLDWMTRGEDVTAHARVPYRMLEAVPGLDGGDRDPANMLIEGDNLDALKALLPFFSGRVKCIYIDPPYNTRAPSKITTIFRACPMAGDDLAALTLSPIADRFSTL